MSDAAASRVAATTGIVVAAAIASWWLGSTRLALDHGSDTSRLAADTLNTLWLVRGMWLAILCLSAGALRGWRQGVAEALALIAPSWPLLALAGSASTVPWTQVALAEFGLLAAGMMLPLTGIGLRRGLRHVELAETVARAAGTALATALWLARDIWTIPLA